MRYNFWLMFTGNWPLLQFRPGPQRPPRENLLRITEAGLFYRLDALAVSQLTVSKHARGDKNNRR